MHEHRTAEVSLTVTDLNGNALRNKRVKVTQTGHKFLFGCNIFKLNSNGSPELDEAYASRFAALLNYATLPFYWGGYESEKNRPDPDSRQRLADWCISHSITTKGHPLCWHEVLPKWVPTTGGAELFSLQKNRIKRDVAFFKGAIKFWDVVNEVCVMPRYRPEQNPMARLCKRIGRAALVRAMFDEAHNADPSARLILNDYDVSDRCLRVIDACLDAGVKIDAIGIQSHMHTGWWGTDKIAQVCDRFGRFGLPLHFTELTILSGALKADSDWHGYHPGWESTTEGEERQAREVEATYRTLFAHPAVHAITWWDFSDLGAWQGAPAGLLRKDMTPKPAYETLRGLVHGEWRTGPLKLETDAQGRACFRGHLGNYSVEINNKRASTFQIEQPGRCSIRVQVARET